MSMKLKAMVEIEVTLTDDEWDQIKENYAYTWREEIKAGDAPKEIGPEDAWNHMLQNDDEPTDFEITWDHVTNEGFED